MRYVKLHGLTSSRFPSSHREKNSLSLSFEISISLEIGNFQFGNTKKMAAGGDVRGKKGAELAPSSSRRDDVR